MTKWFEGLNQIFKNSLLGLLVVGLLIGCVANESGTGRSSRTSISGGATDDTTTPEAPDFSDSTNYLQLGTNTFTTTMPISATNTSSGEASFFLRGEGVDAYIRNANQNNVQCLVVPFSTSAVVKALVIAAYPRSVFNFSTNSQEFYYYMEPQATNNNTAFCQQPGVINQVSVLYGMSSVYDLASLCPSCSLSTLTSNSISTLTQSGALISDFSTRNLKIAIATNSTGSGSSGSSCSSSGECISKGFDCCSNGQCVNDREVKSSVDQTSTAFLQALLDIQNNPSAIYTYSEFFHLCGSNVGITPTPTPTIDPEEEAARRFQRLNRLYACTTPIEGEMAVCSQTYEDVQNTITSQGNNQFSTGADDRNFNTNYTGLSPLPTHSIFEVTYAGETLFENGTIIKGMTIGPSGNGSGNDNLDDIQIINLSATPDASASDDTLNIKYKIDGSCERVSTFLATCYKEYVQGQNESKVTDHFPASNEFLLPYYADTNKTISVTVDDAQRLRFTDWDLVQTTPARIQFSGADLAVFDTQVVRITYFVNLQSYPNVLLKKEEALDEIKTICDCGTTDCFLKEVFDGNDNVIDYSCYYPPTNDTPVPLQQTVLLSSRSTPHRFFDKDGVYHATINEADKEQEGQKFTYTNNDYLRPNNVDTYIGFNEIYGSYSNDSVTALPALEVKITSGKTYDIYTDSGSFSSCLLCGTDYYTSLVKLFPASFLSNGGGYTPDFSTTDPLSSETYRKDDLLFGRACHVPATMIPWSHVATGTREQQRRRRLAAQHFLFANGYQRDWYGFDYGSVIGSFDGVLWFSIGNQRRIQARSNKLFLAVNGYFADLTQDTTFRVTVQDSSTVSGLGSLVTSDLNSDGAECQQAHICETDLDCAGQLGWEYKCESITNMTSPWPRFDVNGLETPGVSDTLNLRNLFGQTTGPTKRCVYRGRGAACFPDYATADSSQTFSGTTQPGLHTCSANSYCQPFVEGVAVSLFNDKISRYGKSVKSQNASDFVDEDDLDVIGLGARTIGRPYAWRGTDTIPNDAQTNLSQNNVTSMCIPGRDNNDDSFLSNHATEPSSEALGDQINAMGVTPTLLDGISTRPDYLSRCSITDPNGNYYHAQTGSNIQNRLLSDSEVVVQAGRQALSTNLLSIFEGNSMTANELIKDFETEFVDEFFYQENRCLRAPGSTCFSNLDCSANPWIASQVSSLNIDDTSVTSVINRYEIKFWQEDLVCSQELAPTDEDYSAANNRCCRETGKEVTIGTSVVDGDGTSNRTLDFNTLPGISTSINSQTRNSRLSTIWDLLEQPGNNYPDLKTVRNDSCLLGCGDSSMLNKQFNTFSEMAGRTCCSRNWVRLFDADENGGGHTWGPDKMQNIPKDTYRCYNYSQCTNNDTNPSLDQCGDDAGDTIFGFSCNHTDEPDFPNCLARQITESQATDIFGWLERFELTGINQVPIADIDELDIRCNVNPEDQRFLGTSAPPGLINPLSEEEYTNGLNERYSAGDMTNFNGDNIKKVFSSDEVVCCIPTGQELPQDTQPAACCTGYIGANNTCQLPGYTDVSLYLNRYVSSEAQDEVLGSFNEETGYLTNPLEVVRIACRKKICESNSLVEGVALNNFRTRGHENNTKQIQRFLDGDDEANSLNGINELYDRGLKFNTHYYCADPELENPLPGTINCDDL